MSDKAKPITKKPKPTGVVLISKDERLSFSIGTSTFFYRRIPKDTMVRLEKEATTRGKRDDDEFAVRCIEYALLGWDGVTDGEGVEVPFSFEMASALPEPVKIAVLKQIYKSVGGEEVDDPLGI